MDFRGLLRLFVLFSVGVYTPKGENFLWVEFCTWEGRVFWGRGLSLSVILLYKLWTGCRTCLFPIDVFISIKSFKDLPVMGEALLNEVFYTQCHLLDEQDNTV